VPSTVHSVCGANWLQLALLGSRLQDDEGRLSHVRGGVCFT